MRSAVRLACVSSFHRTDRLQVTSDSYGRRSIVQGIRVIAKNSQKKWTMQVLNEENVNLSSLAE